MELRVLGCSGGIGGGRKTTSFLIDDDVLIDAGSGVSELSLEEMSRIRHIFLSHSHLDHVHSIPLLLDSIFERIGEPIAVHALPDTIQALQEHIFNWVIWPDFTSLPHPDAPVARFVPMLPGEPVIVGERRFEMIPVNHIVPAVGYKVSGPGGAFAFSGDTTTNDTFWKALNADERLDLLFVECAFADQELEMSRLARHYCPRLLAEDLQKLEHNPAIYLTHGKPGEEQTIYEQCLRRIEGRNLHYLSGNEVFSL